MSQSVLRLHLISVCIGETVLLIFGRLNAGHATGITSQINEANTLNIVG